MTKTNKMRNQFREAWVYLRSEQDEHYDVHGRKMLHNITMGGVTALKEEAKRLQDTGVYSPYSHIGAVELSIMKRLHKLFHPRKSWRNFVRDSVGLKWFGKPKKTTNPKIVKGDFRKSA